MSSRPLPQPLTIRCETEAETDRFAAALAPLLSAGDVVALRGTLGAGKTRLVRGVATALDCDQGYVNSPTFGLVQIYDGWFPLVHIDVYRLSGGDDEFERMGGAELFDAEGATFIEWSERLVASLPRERWTITAAHISETCREYSVTSSHRDAAQRLERLASALAS